MRPHDLVNARMRFFRDDRTNATATATAPAVPGMAFHVTGYALSFSGTPASVVQVELRSNGVPKERIELAAGYIAPLKPTDMSVRPWEMPVGEVTEFVCPALGAGIEVAMTLKGFYSTPSP